MDDRALRVGLSYGSTSVSLTAKPSGTRLLSRELNRHVFPLVWVDGSPACVARADGRQEVQSIGWSCAQPLCWAGDLGRGPDSGCAHALTASASMADSSRCFAQPTTSVRIDIFTEDR